MADTKCVEAAADKYTPQLETLIDGMLPPATLLDLIRHFTVFEKSKTEDPHTGVVTVQTVKKIAYYHQYYAVNKAVESTVQAAASDGPAMQAHHTTKSQRRQLAARFKYPADPLHMVIVVDMWLTGFDAPVLYTLYIDKPMQGHGLMQAIARVNRVYGDKPGGHVVDYLGIAADLKRALSFYAESGGQGSPTETQEEAVNLLLARLEVVDQLLRGFDYRPYFTANTSYKLSLILQAEEHILGLDNGKARFNREVITLGKALALAVPHPQAMAVKERVAFFQAVNARL